MRSQGRCRRASASSDEVRIPVTGLLSARRSWSHSAPGDLDARVFQVGRRGTQSAQSREKPRIVLPVMNGW